MMIMPKGMNSTIFALFLVCILGAPVIAGDSKYDRETLRGVRRFFVVVEGLDADAGRLGLIREQLQTDVELRLRRAGVNVIDRGGENFSYLYVQPTVLLRTDFAICAYNISMEFVQPANVGMPGVSTQVTTWSVDRLVLISSSKASQMLRTTLADLVDEFLNAYLSVNPPKP